MILCQCGERTECRQAKKSGKECDCGIKILEIVLWVGIEGYPPRVLVQFDWIDTKMGRPKKKPGYDSEKIMEQFTN